MSQKKNQWYALRVHSRSEEKVKKEILAHLEKHGLQDQIEDIAVPFQKYFAMRNNKKQVRKRYLGYIFLLFDPSNMQLVRDIHKIDRVYGLMGADGWGINKEPMPISAEEIDRMLGQGEDTTQAAEVQHLEFKPLEDVKVIDGPLKGFPGVVQKVFPEKGKLLVEVKVFKTHFSKVELNYNQVAKITNPSS